MPEELQTIEPTTEDADVSQDQQQPNEGVQATTRTEEPPAASPAPTADSGTETRYKQENARFRQALQRLNINPDSDTMDQLLSGLIDPKDLYAKQETPVQQQETKSLSERFRALSAKARSEGASAEDLAELADLQAELIDRQDQQQQQTQQQQVLQQCVTNAVSALDGDELLTHLPEDIQQKAQHIFLGAVDQRMGQIARTVPDPSRLMKPDVYGHYARQYKPEFDAFCKALVEHGRSLSKPAPPPSGIRPAGASTGTAPAVPQRGREPYNGVNDLANEMRNYTMAQGIV